MKNESKQNTVGKTIQNANGKTTQKELIKGTNAMLSQLLPVKAVKTLDDAITVYRIGEKLNGRASLACAKILAKIKKNELYKGSFKTFEECAKKLFNIAKSTALQWVKMDNFINENADGSIFKKGSEDFTFTVIQKMANTAKVTFEMVKGAVENGYITFYMSQSDIMKKLKILAGDCLEDDKAEQTESEQTESEQTESNATEEQTEKESKERSIKLTDSELNIVVKALKEYGGEIAEKIAEKISNVICK